MEKAYHVAIYRVGQAGMKDKNRTDFSKGLPLFLLKELTVRALDPLEFKKAGELLDP